MFACTKFNPNLTVEYSGPLKKQMQNKHILNSYSMPIIVFFVHQITKEHHHERDLSAKTISRFGQGCICDCLLMFLRPGSNRHQCSLDVMIIVNIECNDDILMIF